MKNETIKYITSETISGFGKWLYSEERAKGTVEKYVRDVKAFSIWLDGREISRESVADWKTSLLEAEYQPVTINSMLASRLGLCAGHERRRDRVS